MIGGQVGHLGSANPVYFIMLRLFDRDLSNDK